MTVAGLVLQGMQARELCPWITLVDGKENLDTQVQGLSFLVEVEESLNDA